MTRRRVWRLVLGALMLSGALALAVVRSHRVRWSTPPTITVIASSNDPRLPLVHEAIDYWNREFAGIGTAFRIGKVEIVTDSVADAVVLALGPTWRPSLPPGLEHYPGDILIILSHANFISLTAPRGNRVVIAIKSADDPRMTENIMRNVIAHELGHALGLEHNADPTLLMCGRPASCRPDIYRSEVPRIFPLSNADLSRLRMLYANR